MSRGELTRRRLLAAAGGGALGLAAMAPAVRALTAAAQALPPPALSPDDPAVRATMAAFADTIVPGPAGGADAEPGALEAGVLDEIYDPFYGAKPTFPLIHDDLAAATPRALGRDARFSLELPYADRERVLDTRMTPRDNPYALLIAAAGILVYVAYYGQARSDAGLRVIGLPPASNGYSPRHSYDLTFRGMTRTSNPR